MNNNILIISILVIFLSSCRNDDTYIQIRPHLSKTYFPGSIDLKEQISEIKSLLSSSKGTCAVQFKDRWVTKPIQNVNFQEISNLWMFSEENIIVIIKKLQSDNYILTLFNQSDTSNTIKLYGQLSEIQISDINNDGNSDILLGIIKKVHFDPTFKKRINIYSYQNHNLQPLWLGTKFIYNIECFNVKKLENFNYLYTLEVDNNGKRFQGIYEWNDFGFALKALNQI
jgi:hypothetical protein